MTNVKKTLRVTGNIISTVLLIAAILFAALVIGTNYVCNKTGEEPFYLGYRPCLVLTGSMEPYMMTNGIVMTKKVDSIDDVAVGDVVTYMFDTVEGNRVYITHRIQEISEDGLITTKGDNNHVADAYALTMDNVIAKVTSVHNQPSVWVINTWTSGTTGKVMLISIVLGILCVMYMISTMISSWLNSEEIEAADINEYTSLCRKLGLIPRDTLNSHIEELRMLLEQEDGADDDPGSEESESCSDEAEAAEETDGGAKETVEGENKETFIRTNEEDLPY